MFIYSTDAYRTRQPTAMQAKNQESSQVSTDEFLAEVASLDMGMAWVPVLPSSGAREFCA